MADVIPVRVAIRVRPLNSREKAENSQECVQCFVEQSQISINGKMFTFDSIFDPTTSQEMIYDACAAPLLEKIFSGYNCTILAYGQTGSGKTYTMGTEETMTTSSEGHGIISRIVDVTASMLEIYEEKVIDLLCVNRECLQIRESKGVVFVQGLSVHPVSCLEDALKLLQKGCQLRSRGETAMNDKSSRSHAIFTLCIEGMNTMFKAKLHLVDLAGSERLKKTQAEGERMREGIKINEGLLALGNVIASLTDQNATGRHIPYRVTKITRLLQDSLGGNSYTVMIACVSPADTNADETLSTLRYADRAKHIKNKPIVNIDPNMALIQGLRDELANVKHELAMLRAGENLAMLGDDQIAGMTKECKRCAELEKQNQENQENYNHHNLRFAEAIAENSKLVEQLLASQQIVEQLRDYMKEIKKKGDNKEFDEAMKILDTAINLRGPIEEEKDKDVFDIGEDDGDDDTSDQAFVNHFTEKQIALNKDMRNILEEIKQKELAFEATIASQAEIVKMCDTYAVEMEQLQAKLDILEKEKQELLSKLKGSSIHHKLSEERRKRLQELEKELAVSKRRMGEIQRLEKENIRLQEQSKKLSTELSELKKLRVKMSKQMKEEEVKFRKWKAMADRKIMQFKNQVCTQREVEIAREQHTKNLQLAVYRRKYEEANACNRRLQMQLAKSTTRTKTCCDGQFISALNDELAVAYSAAEAEIHCQVLIEQRKILSAQQQKLQKMLEKLLKEPPAKRRAGFDHVDIEGEDEKEIIKEQLKNLDKEIQLRGSELAYSDEQREQLWNALRNLTDAKAGLGRLFDATINERRSCLEKDLVVEELRRSLHSVRTELKSAKTEVGNLRRILAEAELCYAQQERDMINIWNEMVEGHFDLPDKVVKNLNLVKEAANNFTNLQQAFDQQRHELEKSRARLYHGRLRRRTGLTDGVMPGRSLSESIMEERGDEGDLSSSYRIRENRKPVERLGVITDLDSVLSDEKEENTSTADSDFSYCPTPQKITRKRQSSVPNAAGRRDTFEIDAQQEQKNEPVAGSSKESDFNPNTTYTVEQCSELDHRVLNNQMPDYPAWIPNEIVAGYIEHGIQTLLSWQCDVLNNQFLQAPQYGNFIFSAPTSAGKTIVAELIAVNTVRQLHCKAVFIFPYISVAKEKFLILQKIWRRVDLRISAFMGSHSSPFQAWDASVCTIEKANSLLNRMIDDKTIFHIGVLVIDEFHMLFDGNRGPLVEQIVAKVLYISQFLNHRIQIIGLSATLPNLDELADWLNAEKYETEFRPIQLHEMIMCDNELRDVNTMQYIRTISSEYVIPNDMEHVIIHLCTESVTKGESVLVFCSSKAETEKLALAISHHFKECFKSGNNQNLIFSLNMESLKEFKQTFDHEVLFVDDILQKHYRLTVEEREMIENAFHEQSLRVICATSTLSSGINLPAHRVIIKAQMSGPIALNSLTYMQMIGRAGRLGQTEKGINFSSS
ncbi:Chromosome-associated kinesin KIF4 [Dirofilaria immitis]|nr:Chromosome-associated kinesin KIF4 [Dirofilaria immitis]